MAECFLTSVAVNLVSKLGEYLFAPIGRQFGYVLCYSSYVEDLQTAVKELDSARERLQHSIDEARRDIKPIHTDVQGWLGNVTKEAEEGQHLLECGKSAENARFCGWIPNPLVRHRMGRKVRETTKVIQGRLHEKRRHSDFKDVSYENTPPGIVTATPSDTRFVDKKEDALESRALIMETVMKALADDKVHVIGVYGLGGVGKSKLLADIKERVMGEKLFDEVALADVSRDPDLKRIQGEIADALGPKLTNAETSRGRAELLHQRLNGDPKKNILIILDNLWKKLELEKVGIPCGEDNKATGCKLLLTSRYQQVLREEMGSDKLFELKKLKHKEARRLFESRVGNRVHDPDFEPLVDGVVRNCGGLPILIVKWAQRLKHRDLTAWRNALDNIEGSDVKPLVEVNYDDLNDKRIQSVFLVCALNSGIIWLKDSLVYCMGLGLYGNLSDTIAKARDRLIEDLNRLQHHSLLDSDDKKWFRMHDLFVDVAISIATTEWNALVGREGDAFQKWSEDELRNCTAISLMRVGIEELPEKLDCPNLKILLLTEHNSSLKISQSFFESMKKLQVLDITGLSFTSLPSSIELLENLKSLSLDQCYLEDVTVLGKLKGLQFLSFFFSTIARLPKEIGGLTELRFLDLTGCTRLKVIEPDVLGSLVNLEELRMEDSFDEWEAEDEAPRSNASLAELKNMKKLGTLYITIPHSANFSSDLPFGNLKEHKIQIGGTEGWWGEYKQSRTLKIKLDSGNLLREACMQECLGRAQDLCLDGLQDGKGSIYGLCAKGFQELKHLRVENNPSFQYVVDSTHSPAFTRLESLVLKNLNKLEKICYDYLARESFSKLKIVKVKNCSEIKHLFHLSMSKNFLQLEEIKIMGCHSMQQVVADAEADECIDGIDDDANVKPFMLRRLILQNLPEMMSFCKTGDHSVAFLDGQQVSLPWLESLTLSALPKLEEIWNSQFLSDVSNLRFLTVEDCALLFSIFPSNLVIKLQNLEAITIERCQSIQEVFNLEGASGDVAILSGLTRLTLSDLPRLGHIWNKNPRITLGFQNLRALKVYKCENLRFLFSSSMAKTLRQIREIEIVNCELLEEIVYVEEEGSKEAASIDALEFPMLISLSLRELPNLRTFSYGTQSITVDAGLQQVCGGVNPSLSLPTLFDQNVLIPSLEELTLVSCGLMKIWHTELSEESFCKLKSITVQDCENLSHIFPSTLIERLQSLKMIEVVKCTSLEALMEHVAVNSRKRQKRLVLLELEEVKLWNLPKLNAFVPSSTKATLSLPSLTNVSLHSCHSVEYLFTSDTSRTIDKLEKLDVSDCNGMLEVIGTEESEERKLKPVKFSHLRKLKLCSLKSLMSFSSGSCAFEFPSLIKLSILECTELKAFILRLPVPRLETMNERSADFDESPHALFDEKVVFPKLEQLRLTGIRPRALWENMMPDESICQLKVLEVKLCPNLLNVIPSFLGKSLLHYMKSLTVEECPHLRNLFTMSMAKSLVQLQYLGLGGCGEMEYIVAREEETPVEVADIIVIPQLATLRLHNMPKLRSFCNGKHISKWPSLEKFTVEDCKAVEVILGDASCRTPEGSVSMQQPLLMVEKVEFPSMESIKISHMDNVDKIWLGELASNAFNKLETLVVEYCQKLSTIFSSHANLTRFQNLKEITVTDCGSLEVIFHVKEVNFSQAISTSTFELRELVLMRLPKMKHVWSGFSQGDLTFGCLRSIEVVECERLKSLFPISVAKSMTQLEELLVRECGVEEIIVEEDGVGMNAGDLVFPRLTDLRLIELLELRSFNRNSHNSIWPLLKQLRVRHCGKMRLFSFACESQSCQVTTPRDNQPALFSFEKVVPQLEGLILMREDVAMLLLQQQLYTFANLKELSLSCYHDENDAFPSDFLLQRFPHLEILNVICSSFEDIFPECAFGHGGAIVKALGNLKRLDLYKLCNLRRVWKDGSLMAEILKQIEDLYVQWCPSLLILLPSPTSFQRLTKLVVDDCAGLVHVGTCSAVTSLVHLTYLILRDCGAMEDVVTDDGNGAKEISFPKLETLILDGLPSLESFSPANCAFRFPSLVHIIVKQCPKMNTFCNGALRTPRLAKVLLSYEVNEGRWESDLNTTIETLSA